jgi:hypothetical protein
MTQLLLALLVVAVSALQAWDSHALEASGPVQLVIAGAIVIPGLAILRFQQLLVRLVAVGISALLLVGARIVSDVPLPELVLAAAFPGILVLLDHFRAVQTAASQARG